MSTATQKKASSDNDESAPDLIDRVQKYLQIASILCAAIWSLWLYMSYDRDKKALDLKGVSLDNKRKALDLEQAKAIAQTEQESKNINVKQQAISLDQQKLTLAQQRLAATIQEQQQNNLMEQQRLQIESQRIGLKASAVDLQAQQIKLGELGQTPIEQHYSLKVHPVSIETGIYRITLSISVTNKSKKEIDIVASELYGYLGTLSFTPKQNRAVAINAPYETGAIEWIQQFQRAYVSIDSSGKQDGDHDDFGRVVGGLAYGRLSSGETMTSGRRFYVFSDRPDRWFGYSLRLHTREKGREDWQYLYDGYANLSDSNADDESPKPTEPS